MKNWFLSLLCGFSIFSFGQEIEHAHSILHSFIENKGQWDNNVLFMSKFDGGNLWVQQNKFVFHLQDFSEMHNAHGNFSYRQDEKRSQQPTQTVVHLNFLGSNRVDLIEKSEPTRQYYNYILGQDKSKWVGDVRGYSEATMKNLYAGIDLKIIEHELELKYEFHVKPNVSPSSILLQFVGQEKLDIDKKGNLRISTALGQIIEEKPYAYQIRNGRIEEVACAFRLKDNQVSFELGSYDSNVELIIDPVLIFATYAGSVTDNFGMTATYASDGSAYSGGTIYGNAYPTPDNNAYDVNSNFTVANNLTYGITDVFLSKYAADGTSMIWTTFLGGGDANQGTETIHSLIADKFDNVYLYGATSSTDFPMQNAFQSTHGGGVANSNYYQNGVYFTNQGTDIYVSKISANGQSLLGSTYIGGSGNDGVNYILSSGIYNSAASYDSLTRNYGDQFRGEVMLDTLGNCLIASCTRSSNFPTLNAFQPTIAGGQDGVIFKLNSNLSSMIWSSYYGGSNNDACYSVKLDSAQNVIFSGGTSSTNLAGMNGWQTSYNGGSADGFVVKLLPNGSGITAASYIGTSNYDQSFFVEVNRNSEVYLIGQSIGGNFPVINSGYSNPGSSQFIVKLNANLSAVLNSTVFGSGSPGINISPAAFLVDICGNVYVSGWGANLLLNTPMSGMPVTADAFQPNAPNGFDFYLFVLKRDFSDILYGSYLGGVNAREHVDGGTSRFDKNGVVYQSVCGGCGGFSDFPTTPGAHSNNNLSSNCNNILFKFDFELIPKAEFTIDDNLGCASFTVTFENTSSDSDSYLWDFGNGNTSSTIYEPTITYNSPGTYQVYLYVTDSICLLTDTAEITITVTDSLELTTSIDLELCVPTEVTMTAFTNGSGSNFIWSDNINFTNILNSDQSDSTLTITPTEPTTYYVQVSNPGCVKIDSVVVDFIGSALTLSGNTTICLGETTTITATNSNASITFTYIWTPSASVVSGQGSNQVVINPTSSEYIFVTASSSNGCVVEDSILVNVGNVNGAAIASASSYIIPEGGSVELYGAPSGYSYQWIDPTTVANPTAQNTSAVLEQTTLFQLIVSDGICTKSDTVLVKTFPFVCDDPYVFVPSGFTPNNDGENDVLYAYGAMIEKMIFRIFDRWGELVFETDNRHIGWNGTFKGKDLDPDVYDYYLEVDCIGGLTNIIKGNVTLMK